MVRIVGAGTVSYTHLIPYILTSGLWMLLIAIGMLATGVLGANFAIRGSSHLAADLRQDIFDRIQKFSFANIDAFSTGSLITRITNDITQIQNCLLYTSRPRWVNLFCIQLPKHLHNLLL